MSSQLHITTISCTNNKLTDPYFNRLVSLTRALSKSAPKKISYHSTMLLKALATINRTYHNYLRRPAVRERKPLITKVGFPWPKNVSNWTLLLQFGHIVIQTAKLKGILPGV